MAYRLSLTHTGIQRRARVHVHRSRPASACTPRVAHHASLHRPPRGECIGGRSRLTLAGPSKRMIKLSDPSPFAGAKGRKQTTCSAFGLNPPTRPSKGSPVRLARAPCVIAGPNERSRCICGKIGFFNHGCIHAPRGSTSPQPKSADLAVVDTAPPLNGAVRHVHATQPSALKTTARPFCLALGRGPLH